MERRIDMKKKWLILCMIGTLLVGTLAGCGKDASGNTDKLNPPQQDASTSVGESEKNKEEASTEKEVYVLEFSDAVSTEGEKFSSDMFANTKLTMINVWATFCGPCINEMPDLGEIAASYDRAEFQIVGIISDTVEGDTEMLTEAKEIITETGADYTHLLLNEELYVKLVSASDSVPTSYFFNQNGELLGYLVGAQSKEAWESLIQELLTELE